jgi:hypothetical protein
MARRSALSVVLQPATRKTPASARKKAVNSALAGAVCAPPQSPEHRMRRARQLFGFFSSFFNHYRLRPAVAKHYFIDET